MRRRVRLALLSFLLGLIERLESPHDPPCNAYGGFSVKTGQVRLCTKRRWHTDSHTYDWRSL